MSYITLITPNNIAEEKERFFNSTNYSPQFQYNWSPRAIELCKSKTPNVSPLLEAIISQDGKSITYEASKFFDTTFRPQDIETAKKHIATIPPSTNGNADRYANLLRKKLTEFGIDYTVKIVDEHGFQGRPNHQNKSIKISKHLRLQYLTPSGIVNHELVHIIRAVNGSHNNIPKSNDYLPTEEGLACLIQDEGLSHPTPSSFQHALEYLAADLSRTAGFREIYNFLVDHGSSPENAWLRGIRQKFGLRDTSQPGGLIKSGMYFYHELLLSQLSKEELLRLFVGKISTADLPSYTEYTGAVPQEKLLTIIPDQKSAHRQAVILRYNEYGSTD